MGGGGDTVYLAKFNTDVNLFVVRFDLDAHMATLFVNPDGDVDQTGAGDGSLTLFSKLSFDRVCIANFAGKNEFVVDEIQIAETPPALATPAKRKLTDDRESRRMSTTTLGGTPRASEQQHCRLDPWRLLLLGIGSEACVSISDC